jgi:hypothetical protein
MALTSVAVVEGDSLTSVAVVSLKVPKNKVFMNELFILSDPIWVGDLRTVSDVLKKFGR